MDWKYILSLTPEDLGDDEKDDLFNTIAWFNSEGEDVSSRKIKALFKLSQEVLKYKGEQVETLLHELDELAIKQGEEEARKIDSDNDATARSSRSRKSSSIEYENLEQKLIELKAKHKKQIKLNERSAAEMEKLNIKIRNLEQENRQLQNEIQNKSHEGSESDLSETVKDQRRELVEAVHNKNKQISDLLQDIEQVEKENGVLREKLTNVRDELSNATREITIMTDQLNASEMKLQENIESFQKLSAEKDNLQEELSEAQDKRRYLEEEMEEFSKEINKRIDDWKKLLDQKDAEIHELKSRTYPVSPHSSLSSLPNDDYERSNTIVLSKVLNERENQLLEFQTKLQQATNEMEASTNVIHKLKTERDADRNKIKQLMENVAEMKKQLKAAHERCQDLQDEVVFVEKTVASKDADLKDAMEKIEENGHAELSLCLKQMQGLKAQKRIYEKQIMSLVKTSNKLQDAHDQFEKENLVLREKLGIPEDKTVSLGGISARQRKHVKELESVKKELSRGEEEKLELKGDVQKLNRMVASLSDQILDLGHKPTTGYENIPKTVDFKSYKEQLKSLAEENEALRKGMHEILNSINSKKETTLTEIKSETFEKLLRALDVKHISGWYHPAMRLQAEVHNLEGINKELREQLRLTKKDLLEQKIEEKKEKVLVETDENIVKSKEEQTNDVVDTVEEVDEVIVDGQECDFESIQRNFENILKKLNNKSFEDGLEQFRKDLYVIQKQLEGLLKEKTNERQVWEENLQRKNNLLEELQNKHEVTEAKLKVFTENETEESLSKKVEEFVSTNILLGRKIEYLKNEVDRINKDTEILKNEFKVAEVAYRKTIDEVTRNKESVSSKLRIAENLIEMSVDPAVYKEVQKNLSNLTTKYRDLLENVKHANDEKALEVKILKEAQNLLEQEKQELKTKLVEVLKLVRNENLGQDIDENVEKLTRKLAECEVNEISEKQRANHTNNLYELVKDQLQKSEERFKEFSKYNEDVMHKNLLLQEQLKEAEQNLAECVNASLYSQLQAVNNDLLKENEKFQSQVGEIEEKLRTTEEVLGNQQMWTALKEQELLGLKHQIVDLIADSDDKMQIALLHSDIRNCRKVDAEQRNTLEKVNKELMVYKEQYENAAYKSEQDKVMMTEKEQDMQKKIAIMQDLLLKQKLQYFGCIPSCSEEKFISKLLGLHKEKHDTFMHLHKTKLLEKESQILKEQCEIELQNLIKQKQIVSGDKEEFRNVLNWMQEKKGLQLNELRYRRQSEFKEVQMGHLVQRIQTQDEQIAKLEEELFVCHTNFEIKDNTTTQENQINEIQEPPATLVNLKKSEEVQTEEIVTITSDENNFANIKSELLNVRNELVVKEQLIEQLRSKIMELEMNISMFKKQIGDKQNQISFYEQHILELQSKKEEFSTSGPDGDNINVGVDVPNEDVIALKATIKTLQETLADKEEKILEYQSLLKEDRDKHSLAAERLQEELKNLQKSLTEEKQKFADLDEYFNKSRPNMANIEQYISQVHVLEKHTAELHTNVTSLDAQLHSSRQEAVRWRELANDRLEAMEGLRGSLEEQHKSELSVYKNDSEKWREEVNSLKELISVHRSQAGHFGDDIKNLLKLKENKIQELMQLLRQARIDVKKSQGFSSDSESSKLTEIEAAREGLLKENESLKKRYEQLLNRERGVREEIRELKTQLLKKQTFSTRNDKSEKSIKEQLQKKVTLLENEIVELKDKLSEQIAINDTHKIKISEDFDRWKKHKQWQQNAEKMKNKLKERDSDLEKLQQTCTGYRLLIERLEREKHNLENRIKNLKRSNVGMPQSGGQLEMLQLENMKLLSEVQTLSSKLEMQQHHSGGLGAAMLQEKLESQERKIAVLELTAKGSVEVRNELERLQTSISTLQKSNLCFEAENLDLKLDLEKSNHELPHLREQIQHLENYIEVLKSENSKQQNNVDGTALGNGETKKVSELERTVFILKRVVEKLQTENKRLLNGKRPYSDCSASADKLKRDYQRVREQYRDCLKKVEKLEADLAGVHNGNKHKSGDVGDSLMSDEKIKLKEQLEQKSQLLDKVKILLHRAAVKEKSLLQEIAELKGQNEQQPNTQQEFEDNSD